MQHTTKIVDNLDLPSPKREDREYDLKNWNKDEGLKIAEQEGIEMTDTHWDVVHFLRDYYLLNGPVKKGRTLSDALDSEFAEHGGKKYLRSLFPKGPVGQGMRIAGLKVPPLTEDDGFGVSY